MRMTTRTTIFASLVYGVAIGGCVDRPFGEVGDAGATSGSSGGDSGGVTGSTGGVPTTGSTGGEGPTSGGTTTGTESGTTAVSTEGGTGDMGSTPCDVWTQDCAEGQKCVPWDPGGGYEWEDNVCVDFTGDQQPGEPCTGPEGGVPNGKDDCVEGAICWFGKTGEAAWECLPLCTGSFESPTCADGFHCSVSQDGFLPLCLPVCDPLAQDCGNGYVCLPAGDTFDCVLDVSGAGGQVFDPCEQLNACDPGLLCAEVASASECQLMEAGCCQPMCSISAMAPCPGVGQECVSLWAPGKPPPQHADIGFCTLPP